MKTIIYVDGFNLYYGCLKGTPFKWVNLLVLFQNMLKPENDIVEIKYYTALIKPTSNDASAPQRQAAYIRALKKSIPIISIQYGFFSRHKVRMANVNPPPNTCEVYKTEEKGSDVNLAVHLLNDAWLNRYDCAIVVSNDSDMAEAMRLVKIHHPKKVIGLVTPGEHTRTSEQLRANSNFVIKIRKSALAKSQMPDIIPNSNIRKPDEWL